MPYKNRTADTWSLADPLVLIPARTCLATSHEPPGIAIGTTEWIHILETD